MSKTEPLTESTSLVTGEDTSVSSRMRVYLIFLAPAFAGFQYGYDIGSVSGSIASLDNTLGETMTAFQTSALTSASIIGATVASIIAFYVGEPLGRRREIILGSFFYFLGSVLTEAGPTYGVVFVSRFIYGIGIGFSMHAAPLYIAEIAPVDVRGTLIALKEAFIIVGMVTGFGLLAGLEQGVKADIQWRISWALPIPFALGVMCTMLFIAPPSPRWLVLQGKPTEALAALKWLLPQASEETLEADIAEMVSSVSHMKADMAGGEAGDACSCCACVPGCDSDERTRWARLFSAKKALIAGIGLVALQQLTGQPTVLYYVQSTFEAAGFSTAAAKNADLIVGATKLIATLLSVPLVDRLGRRPLLLAGTSVMFVALIILTIGFGLEGGNLEGGWSTAVIFALMLYVSGYQLGFGPITWVLISELFPLHSRARALGVAVICNFALNLLVTLTNGPLVDALGQAALFGIFAGMCVLSLVFVGVYVPETKGKTLEEIDAMLK